MNLVSVIIPVYNVEEYLCACLDSVLNQTYKNLEVILINDGSTDKSALLCDEYAKKDARVRVIHQINKGISETRNIGMKSAQGEWWTFVDSDDVIHPQMIEVLLNIASNNKDCKIVCCNNKRVYKKNNFSFDPNINNITS